MTAAPSMAEVIIARYPSFDRLSAEGIAQALAAAGFGHVASVERERDAYRKAKQENDERFQIEAQEQRARAETAEARLVTARDALKALRDEWWYEPSGSTLLNAQAAVRVMHVLAALDGEGGR